MSTNSILESWMDDNSITEKPLRRGIAPEPRIPLIGCPWPHVIFFSILILGLSLMSGMFLGKHLTDEIWEEKLREKREMAQAELDGIENAVLPDKLVKRNLRDVKVGEVVFVHKFCIRTHRDSKKMWADLDGNCYEKYDKSCAVQLERIENGFAATLFEERFTDPLYRFETNGSPVNHANLWHYLPILSLEIRKKYVNE
jgi:hypothetical protein